MIAVAEGRRGASREGGLAGAALSPVMLTVSDRYEIGREFLFRK